MGAGLAPAVSSPPAGLAAEEAPIAAPAEQASQLPTIETCFNCFGTRSYDA